MATQKSYEGTSGRPPWEAKTMKGKPIRDNTAGNVRTVGFTFRDHGSRDWIFPVSGVNPGSDVAASLTEVNPVTGVPFQGLASVLIFNVVPGDRTISVRMEIGWQTDISLQISFIFGV